MPKKVPIIVVGQTPPPFGGQAVMIEMLLAGQFDGIELIHVRMDFSKEMSDMGRWRFSKMTSLVRIIWKVYAAKIKHGARILYYPPSGPRTLPVMRDVAILLSTRWLFKKVIFHFHATGLSKFRLALRFPLSAVYDWAFLRPDISIRLAEAAPSEGAQLATGTEYIVANGIADAAGSGIERADAIGRAVRILFVAVLVEDKGLLDLIDAFCQARDQGCDIELTCMGKWDSPELEKRAHALLVERNCEDRVKFPGVLTGERKWAEYRAADIFCFPTFFHSETFPVVLLEAMCFSLPIISTRWRGIPYVVDENVNAFLVDVRDTETCAKAIGYLVSDDSKRSEMGKASRNRFMQNFTAEAHWRAMQQVFDDAAGIKRQ